METQRKPILAHVDGAGRHVPPHVQPTQENYTPRRQSRGQRDSVEGGYNPTISTSSPYQSPTSQGFPDQVGLAPRPTSMPYGGQENARSARTDSHRRHNSKAVDKPLPPDPPGGAPPTVPDVPRPPPPVAYANGSSNVSSQGAARSSSQRTRVPPSQQSTLVDSEQDFQPVAAVGSSGQVHRKHGSRSSREPPPTQQSLPAGFVHSPAESRAVKSNSARHAPVQNAQSMDPASYPPEEGDGQRDWAPDRSPLQKLELTLNDISKEEKRARVEEAEILARERISGRGGSRSSRNGKARAIGPDETGAVTQGETLADAGLVRNLSNKQKDRLLRTATIEKKKPELSPVTRAEQFEYQEQQYSQPAGHEVPEMARATSPYSTSPVDPRVDHNRAQKARTQDIQQTSPTVERNRSRRGPAAAAVASATAGALAATAVGHHDVPDHPPGASRNVVQSSTRNMPLEEQQKFSSRAAPSRQWHGHVDDPYTAPTEEATEQEFTRNQELAKTHTDEGPTYKVPPQVTNAQAARERVEIGTADQPTAVQRSIRGSIQRHLHQDHYPSPQSRTQELSEWKNAGVARLTAPDLALGAMAASRSAANEAESATDGNKAWWEGGGSSRKRRTSSTRKSAFSPAGTTVDGSIDQDHTPQTSFRPPLFMKCGPLLRYTGIRHEGAGVPSSHHGGTASARREFWRGSIMIVTIDSESSYDVAPTLRLFSQPMNLLPPPPAHIDGESGGLAPEYVDPIAGLVKLGRNGKTLYVRPVEHLEEERDLSRVENDGGLFEEVPSAPDYHPQPPLNGNENGHHEKSMSYNRNRLHGRDGEAHGKFQEVKGIRLHAERGVTFWRFNLEVELGEQQARIAYRINRGPAVGFWVPGRGETMNIMFHSCNGFSHGTDTEKFCGPDPMWRDVLNNHQTRPFHVMIGGGDQVYNDVAMTETTIFKEWTTMKNPHHKRQAQFTRHMQDELEGFYLDRYAMWFSQGLFGLANSQIPMVNLWDDHDIIDGYGSYSHHIMSSPVFTGLGAVAFKYYMLFQHQSVVAETSAEEPSWILGASLGPYINQQSRNVFMSLGKNVAFLGLDARTERMRDECLCEDTYDIIFERCREEIVKGETKHLIVLLGVPIAYPRMVWLETILTSRIMDPVKAMGRAGMFGNLLNKFDGGVEVLDDLDDHWTAKNHKDERNWLIQELQELAAERSVRVTILSGDVHLGAIGHFYSNPRLALRKDRDHRYMPNVISSAIVNTPPPEMLADVLNKRDKVHHLDKETDEKLIPMFTHDVDGKKRNNKGLLPRRNWCSIREYHPGSTPPPTPPESPVEENPPEYPPGKLQRSWSMQNSGYGGFMRRFSIGGGRRMSYDTGDNPYRQGNTREGSIQNRNTSVDGYFPRQSHDVGQHDPNSTTGLSGNGVPQRPNTFRRQTTGYSEKSGAGIGRHGSLLGPRNRAISDPDFDDGHINLEYGLDIVLNVEVSQKDPAGITTPYRLLVPALYYRGPGDMNAVKLQKPRHAMPLAGPIRANTLPIGVGQRDGAESPDFEDSRDPSIQQRRGPRAWFGSLRRRGKKDNLAADDEDISSGASSERRLPPPGQQQHERHASGGQALREVPMQENERRYVAGSQHSREMAPQTNNHQNAVNPDHYAPAAPRHQGREYASEQPPRTRDAPQQQNRKFSPRQQEEFDQGDYGPSTPEEFPTRPKRFASISQKAKRLLGFGRRDDYSDDDFESYDSYDDDQPRRETHQQPQEQRGSHQEDHHHYQMPPQRQESQGRRSFQGPQRYGSQSRSTEQAHYSEPQQPEQHRYSYAANDDAGYIRQSGSRRGYADRPRY